MHILIKNKNTLILDDFEFKCCVGKHGFTKSKVEGDKKTPIGIFNLGSGKNISVQKIIDKIKKITGCEVLISNQNNFENYPLLNLSKIKKIINFKIKDNLLNDLPKIIINEKN